MWIHGGAAVRDTVVRDLAKRGVGKLAEVRSDTFQERGREGLREVASRLVSWGPATCANGVLARRVHEARALA